MNILDSDNTNTNTNILPEPSPLDTSGLSLSALKKIKKVVAEDRAQQKRTWAYWEKLRKTNYPEYTRSKSQMYRDADALGASFFGEED